MNPKALLAVVFLGFALETCALVSLRPVHVRRSVIQNIEHQNSFVARLSLSLGMAKSDKEESDSVRRRRSRRKRDKAAEAIPVAPPTATIVTNPPASADKQQQRESTGQPVITARSKENDGTASLEDMFGLGNEQLRELMEQELPVPREDLVTLKEKKNDDPDKVFALPDLSEFIDPKQEKEELRAARSAYGEESVRIDRSDREEYARVMQLNPFADADDTMFLEEYDIIPSIFGSGKLLGIPVPYLQTGHGILLLVCVLAGFVYAPGNPLTEFPLEIRDFLKTGLGVVYSINTVLAVQGFFNAKSKNLPAAFWGFKCLLLGGIAYYEVTQAVDPSMVGKGEDKSYLSDRKSKNSNPEKWRR